MSASPHLRHRLEYGLVRSVAAIVRQVVGRLLAERSGWRRVYQDDAFEVFARPGLALPYVDSRGKRIEPLFP